MSKGEDGEGNSQGGNSNATVQPSDVITRYRQVHERATMDHDCLLRRTARIAERNAMPALLDALEAANRLRNESRAILTFPIEDCAGVTNARCLLRRADEFDAALAKLEAL